MSAGTFAFEAADPTDWPAFPTVDPTELPTLLMAPVTPLVDGFAPFGRELRARPLRDAGLLAADAERDRAERGDALLAADVDRDRLPDVFLVVLRVPPEDLCVLRLEPRGFDLRRVVACAIPAPFL